MKFNITLIGILLVSLYAAGQQTVFEISGGKKTATYAEIVS